MKVTQEQKEAIIKRAKAELKEWEYLCIALSNAIDDILGIECCGSAAEIKKVFPRFTNRNAVQYFGGRRKYSWWTRGQYRLRLLFLDYILTGKLPKKPIK
jgi:hypothetical protein